MYSESELHNMKLKELKGICKEWKVKQTGSKQEVVQRLGQSVALVWSSLHRILTDFHFCHTHIIFNSDLYSVCHDE